MLKQTATDIKFSLATGPQPSPGLARLQSCAAFESRVKLYIPSQDSQGCSLEEGRREAAAEQTARTLSHLFGGCTRTRGRGYYLPAPDSALAREDVYILDSACSPADLAAGLEGLISYALNLRENLNQDSIGLEINGVLYWVK